MEGNNYAAKQKALQAVYGKPSNGHGNPEENAWENGDDNSSYTPIKSLNTFLFDWKIKARVTKKHAKKIWKNSRSEGTLLNVELIDNQST